MKVLHLQTVSVEVIYAYFVDKGGGVVGLGAMGLGVRERLGLDGGTPEKEKSAVSTVIYLVCRNHDTSFLITI